jgi:hypothetical protein
MPQVAVTDKDLVAPQRGRLSYFCRNRLRSSAVSSR